MLRNGKISETLFTVDFGINSTYLHAHMPKMNSSSVKICESSRPRLARVLAQKISIVTRAVVFDGGEIVKLHLYTQIIKSVQTYEVLSRGI